MFPSIAFVWPGSVASAILISLSSSVIFAEKAPTVVLLSTWYLAKRGVSNWTSTAT